jgi:thiamine biosynthesis lipoprotein
MLTVPAPLEIDFGGICKEYAADRVLALLRQRHPISVLVNLGGDIAADGDRVWSVGIEAIPGRNPMAPVLHLSRGAVATSGTTHRGAHIFNPKTGRPVDDAPASVTVVAPSCTEAGFWSTLGMLNGATAEQFLAANALDYWCYRSA